MTQRTQDSARATLESEDNKEKHLGLWVFCLLFSLASGSLLLVFRAQRLLLVDDSLRVSHGFKTSLGTWLKGETNGGSPTSLMQRAQSKPTSQPVDLKSSGPRKRQCPSLFA